MHVYIFFFQNVIPVNERCIYSQDYFTSIEYLRASLPQITVLRGRSTYCNQDLIFECSGITEITLSDLGVWYDYDDNEVQFENTNIGECNGGIAQFKYCSAVTYYLTSAT